jgi:uncharacterized beta-barrel protein YwiB (DUF1934 family)
MKRDVQIKIAGIQNDGEQEEVIETIVFGEFHKIGNSYCLKYEELSEEGDAVRTLVRVSDEGIEVNKWGNTSSKMVLIENRVTQSDYGTPYGIIRMSMDTMATSYELEENSFVVQAEYALHLDGQFISTNRLLVEASFID